MHRRRRGGRGGAEREGRHEEQQDHGDEQQLRGRRRQRRQRQREQQQQRGRRGQQRRHLAPGHGRRRHRGFLFLRHRPHDRHLAKARAGASDIANVQCSIISIRSRVPTRPI
jgi:hypothetical protein